MNLGEIRRRMVIKMGCKCAYCGAELPPENLIIHHTGFEKGERVGHDSKRRIQMLLEFERTGYIPPDIKLACDRCNRKRHKYRPSNLDIFGANP